jgi:hypothetical protein
MNEISMHSVTSSQLKSVGYNEETRTLYIEFINGTVYQYHDFPKEKFAAMLIPTMSVGQYFQKEIKQNPAQLYSKTTYKVEDGKLIRNG